MRIRNCFPICLSVIVALLVGGFAADAEAQLGRRIGSRLRQTPPAPAPNAADTQPRQEGQFRQRLQNLGGKLQTAIDSGALEGLTGEAGEALPSLLSGSMPGALPAGLSAPSQLKAQMPAGTQPFTPAWYANHPQAWQYAHPHADAWAVASIGTAAAWLGITVLPPAEAASGDNVFTSESIAPPAPAVSADGEYLSLGVFAFGPAGSRDASALLQFALSKDGTLQGNYYDIVTGQAVPLTGSLDKQTQLATVKLDAPAAAELEISLVSLTRAEGSARLRFDDGQTRDWTLARFTPPVLSLPPTALPPAALPPAANPPPANNPAPALDTPPTTNPPRPVDAQ